VLKKAGCSIRKQESPMTWHYLEKEYYDAADDIEVVSIHYICTPLSGVPDWENQGVTLYMPISKPVSQVNGQTGTAPLLLIFPHRPMAAFGRKS
jgi:hypothetical protein